ncbi:MAG TPA: phenylalanine--tRNA ligase subunit beta [Bryobacteraceae bacterium]|nr:phenylalanine--tRNA ligase subunit beta [Bryobacteraceae bacterium]
MNFSYNWLSELVTGLDIDAEELARLITMKTAESEGVHRIGAHLDAVCTARVIAVEPIAGSHNVKATVETARYGTKTVVCGAPNCRVGVVTAYVPAGTSLGDREIGKATISGVVSDGMLASGAELGLNRDSEGILELAADPGLPVPGCRPDWIIEIDNKSITHRPDLWGHFGMAREVSAITGKPLRDPVRMELIPDAPAPVKVAIENLDLCPRYSALVLENVTVQPSPLWLQARLEAVGLNPINNIVDVTNYVMAELAQPMHAFDADLFHGDTIYIRPAEEGAILVALNGESYTLSATNLVIADAHGAVAVAGVIGGMDSSINERTKRIVLESANFQASSVRKTSVKLKLRTDASMRYEKAQDPVNTARGIARAIELFQIVSPGIRIAGGMADQTRPPRVPAPIELPLEWLARKLGRDLPSGEVKDILERLQFGVSEARPGVFSVTVPSWRATKDVSIKDDLVEEVGRMIGYSSIPPQPPMMPVTVPPVNGQRLFERKLRAMTAAQGFTEVYNYSFLSEDEVKALMFDPEAHVRVANPIAADQTLMRTSLLPGIYGNILDNSRNFETFRLFEIGQEIHKQAEGLPDEAPHLAAAMYEKDGGQASLFELKRLAECLMPGAEVRPAAAREFEHPARTADIVWRGETAGRLFEFHPSMIETGRAAVLDLDLRVIERLAEASEWKYEPIRRYPSSAFDLSVIAGERELVGDLRKKVVEFAGDALDSIEYLRQYSGSPIPEGKKSVSYRLTVAAQDHTLSLEEVGAIRQRIIEGMQAAGYELRV